jgi:DNA end-binding protein Ku
MPRPLWTGAISFGLVNVPVKLYSAVSRRSLSFNQLDDRTMARIRYRKVSALDGSEVPEDHIVKGFELSKDRYVVVDPDELEPFLPAATRSIELEDFVELPTVDPQWFDASYHVAPDRVVKPYRLLVAAMSDAGRAGVGRMVMRNKQYVVAVRAVEGRLLLSTMVYADELVPANSIEEFRALDDVELSERELAMAGQLVASMSGRFEPERYHDDYREQVLALIARKAAGEVLESVAPAAASPVVDLMAALEASVQAARAARERHPSTHDLGADPGEGTVARRSA